MKLGIYSGSDPRLATTWSGTTSNLIAALENASISLDFYHAEQSLHRGFLATVLEKASPASALFSKVGSRHLVNNIANHFHSSGCDTVLHIPGDHLPHPGCSTSLRHLAFIDSTFEQFLMPWFKERHERRSRVFNILLDLEMRRRNRYYRISLSTIEHFFVTSDWVKKSLVNSYGIAESRVTTCYTGTGKILYSDTARDSSHSKLLFVARHNYTSKGASVLLEAFRQIREKHKHAELILVGPDPEGLGIGEKEERVTVHSFMEWQDLEKLFNTATLFAMPSLYEPYGLVYLEAMKCGTPVVCSANGGMSSIVSKQNCGWVLDRRDAASLAEILDSALSYPHECLTKGANGKAFVDSYCSWDRCARLIRDYLESRSPVGPS